MDLWPPAQRSTFHLVISPRGLHLRFIDHTIGSGRLLGGRNEGGLLSDACIGRDLLALSKWLQGIAGNQFISLLHATSWCLGLIQ